MQTLPLLADGARVREGDLPLNSNYIRSRFGLTKACVHQFAPLFQCIATAISLFSLITDDVSERLINKGPCDWWPDFYLSSRFASVAGREDRSIHPV
jgi:hypothetical protein